MNRAAYYNSLRPYVNLTTQNVEGMERVLDYGLPRDLFVTHLAKILATAWWESAQTMQPVKEAYWKSEAWRKANLRYYPWYGRGLVQTTWEDNYRKMSPIVGADLIKNPNALLQWKYALPALFIGMERGLYTGLKISDFIDEVDESDSIDFVKYKEARRVVNGTDKADAIAKLALTFERALKAGGYHSGVAPAPTPEKETIMDWQSIQQVIRIILYTGGGMIFGEGFMDGELAQSAIGGVLSIGAFIWWMVWEKAREPDKFS